MNSFWSTAASLSVAPAPGNAVTLQTEFHPWLVAADKIILVLGLAVTVAAIIMWQRRGKPKLINPAMNRPNQVTPELVTALAFGYILVSMLAGSVAAKWSDGPATRLYAGVFVQFLGALACLISAGFFFQGGLRRFLLGTDNPLKPLAQAVILTLVAISTCHLIFEATHWLILRVKPDFQPPDHQVLEALSQGSSSAWLLRLGAVLVAPVAEECFFRGLFQTVVRNLQGRPWPAIIITAVLFGAAHSQQPQAVPPLIVLGVLLGVFYERTGSLIGPIALHIFFNAKTLIWQAAAAV